MSDAGPPAPSGRGKIERVAFELPDLRRAIRASGCVADTPLFLLRARGAYARVSVKRVISEGLPKRMGGPQ